MWVCALSAALDPAAAMGIRMLSQSTILIIVSAFAISVGFVAVWLKRSSTTHIRRRHELSEKEWLKMYLSCGQDHDVPVIDFLRILAADLHVSWTMLRPTDTFEKTYICNCGFSDFDALVGAEDFIRQWCARHDYEVSKLLPLRGTLSHYLTLIGSVSDKKDSQ